MSEQSERHDSGDPGGTTDEGSSSARARYEERVEDQIEEWENQIERLRERLRKAQSDLKEGIGRESQKYEKELESLRVKRDAARKVLQELTQKGGQLWEDFQKDLGQALAGAGDGLHRLAERLRKEEKNEE